VLCAANGCYVTTLYGSCYVNEDGSLTPEARKALGLPSEEEQNAMLEAQRSEHEREYGLTKPFLQFCDSTSRSVETFNWASQLIDAYEDEQAASIFWPVVADVWNSFDKIDHAKYSRLFQRFKRWRPPKFVRDLPSSSFTIYRGQSDLAPLGLSWTTKKEVAEEFAAGHRGMRLKEPVIFERVIFSDQVAFRADDRDEAEVVLFKVPHRKTVFREVLKLTSR